jgi:hypothetical protein
VTSPRSVAAPWRRAAATVSDPVYRAKLAAGEYFADWRLPETALCLRRLRGGAPRMAGLAKHL